MPSEEFRTFTAKEANALLPQVRAIVERMRAEAARAHETEELVADLDAYYGDSADAPDNPEREKREALRRTLAAAEGGVGDALLELHALGIEVKDIERGLIDFHGLHDGRIVYLCWESGEPAVAFWHPLESGFAGRQPLDEGG